MITSTLTSVINDTTTTATEIFPIGTFFTNLHLRKTEMDTCQLIPSSPGTFAFKSSNNGMNGSVFLHFLAKVLQEEGDQQDLSTMLLRVTREVAVSYESYVPGNYHLDMNKQIPYTVSTLMRKVFFNSKWSRTLNEIWPVKKNIYI